MGRTFVRQDAQIRNSITYDDTLAVGSSLETQTQIEGDLNALQSQVKRLLWDDDSGNWYDDVATYNSKKRGLNEVGEDLDALEETRLLFRTQVLTDITVPGGQNYVVLSVTGSEAPTQTAAVGAVTTEGAVVAAHGGTFGTTHALTEVAGPSAVRPKNLVVIRENNTSSEVLVSSNGKAIWGLIQSESATDGHTFDDTNNQVQISFVEENTNGDDLIAVSSGDIGGQSINYMYPRRSSLSNLPEDAYLGGVFLDQAATTDVTLQNAITNQSGVATQGQDIDVNLTDTYTWAFRDTGGNDLWSVYGNAGAGTSEVHISSNTDIYNNDAVDVDFSSGIAVGSSGTEIAINETAGVIERAADLILRSSGSGETYLDDSNQTGSTWSQTDGIKLSETTAEWDAFEAAFGGEVSLLNAITEARNHSARTKGVAYLTTNVAADTNITGAGGTPNISAQLPDYSGVTFVDDVDIMLNGVMMWNGANAAANNDVYPGTTPANGDLMFEFALKGSPGNPDVITMVIHGS